MEEVSGKSLSLVGSAIFQQQFELFSDNYSAIFTGGSLPAYQLRVEMKKANPFRDSPLRLNIPARLVAVMVRLVRAVHRHAEVFGLGLRELGQLDADAFEVQAGDFFVQLLRQAIHADFV